MLTTAQNDEGKHLHLGMNLCHSDIMINLRENITVYWFHGIAFTAFFIVSVLLTRSLMVCFNQILVYQ